MICLKCNSFKPGFVGRLCPVCSEPLQLETNSNRDKLVLGRIRDYITKWQKTGKISKKSLTEFELALEAESNPEPKEISVGFIEMVLKYLQGLLFSFFSGFSKIFEPILIKNDETSFTKKSGKRDIDASFESATDALFNQDNSNLTGIEALTELDESKKTTGKYRNANYPKYKSEENFEIWKGLQIFFNEYIWWFIGSLLVLSGSIMGIREAWNVLSGVNRHLTVLLAVVIYQYLFVSLGIFLGKRLNVTGKLLSSISLLLLPISYSVSSDLIIANFEIGLVAVFCLIGITAILLNLVQKQFISEQKKYLYFVIPSLLVQGFIPWLGAGFFTNLFIFLPLILLFQMSRIWAKSESGNNLSFLLSIYGSIGGGVVYFLQLMNATLLSIGSFEFTVLLLWLLIFNIILSTAFGSIAIQFHSKKGFHILEVIFLAIVIVLASTSGLSLNLLTNSDSFTVRILLLIIPYLATHVFFITIKRHTASIHPFMLLSIFSSFLTGLVFFPLTDWSFAFVTFIPVLGIYFTKTSNRDLKISLLAWGYSTGVSILFYLYYKSFFVADNQSYSLLLPLLFVGTFLSVVSHIVGGYSRSIFHIIGGGSLYFTFYGVITILLPFAEMFSRIGISFVLLASLYSILAILFDEKLRSKEDGSLFPFDDVSLLACLVGLLFSFFSIRSTTFENSILLFSGFISILRSNRDKSSLSSFIGAMIFSLGIFRICIDLFGDPRISSLVLSSSIIASTLGLLCILFPNINPEPIVSRKAFYFIRLPFPAQSPVLIRNALSATSLLYVITSSFLFFNWLSLNELPERNYVITSMGIIVILFLIGFFTRALNSFQLRGSSLALALIFVFIGFAAIANRIGRPLPPKIVGINLTLGIIALWVLVQFFIYKGDRIANWLDNLAQGKYYPYIPLAAMCIIGFVLLVDVFLLNPNSLERFLYITPPTFFIGSGLSAFLFFLSTRLFVSLSISLLLFSIAFGLAFTQESITGIELVRLSQSAVNWVPFSTSEMTRIADWSDPIYFLPRDLSRVILIYRFTLGILVAGLIYSSLSFLLNLKLISDLFKRFQNSLEHSIYIQFTFANWSFLIFCFLCLVSYKYAFDTTGYLSLASGGLLVFSGLSRQGTFMVAMSVLLLIHGYSHNDSIYPSWSGPLLAFIGFLLIILVRPVSSITKKQFSRILESYHAGSFIYSSIGIVYALAAFSPTFRENAVPRLVSGALSGFLGGWTNSYVLGLTLFIIAISLWIGARHWTHGMTSVGVYTSSLFFGFAGITIFPFFTRFLFIGLVNLNLLEMIPFFAFIVTIVSIFYFYSSIVLNQGRADITIGASYGSDTLILLVGLFLAIFIRFQISSSIPYASLILVITILLIITLTLTESFILRRSHHFYFSQVSIASFYLVLKPSFPELLTPEVDALFALIFGFILTGITAIARSAGIPPLEQSTRRFAAFM
ncbi:MAG TPA: hypothetical protein PKD50_12835, partial [Leptospiraceae bacterium]|nr:hypothetical protein [Leptospiraceae bacterium]